MDGPIKFQTSGHITKPLLVCICNFVTLHPFLRELNISAKIN